MCDKRPNPDPTPFVRGGGEGKCPYKWLNCGSECLGANRGGSCLDYLVGSGRGRGGEQLDSGGVRNEWWAFEGI